MHLSRTLDGIGALDGTLSPEGYATLKTALRVAESPDADGDPPRTPAQRRHDALIDIVRHFLDHQRTRPGGRHRPHLNVIVDVEALTECGGGLTADGTALDPDGTLHVTDPTGRTRSTRPPGTLWPLVA